MSCTLSESTANERASRTAGEASSEGSRAVAPAAQGGRRGRRRVRHGVGVHRSAGLVTDAVTSKTGGEKRKGEQKTGIASSSK